MQSRARFPFPPGIYPGHRRRMNSSDEIEGLFAAEVADDLDDTHGPEPAPWPVLIVDDDEEVHTMTRLVLSRMRYKDRPLELLTARSGAEAAIILQSRDDIAVAVLDIVMETDDAGLVLARRIREEFNNTDVRIVLRTGQPGQAPVRHVILNYDINDYKAKTELTADVFFISMITALRSFDNIRSARAAEGASQLKSAFLATVSHEIRNPMHAVLANLELLARTSLNTDQAEMLSAASGAAGSLLHIIDDILDFSKIEAGKMDIDRQAMSLRGVVESVADSLAVQARGKGLELYVRVDPRMPPCVAGDPVRLRQVLYNLAGNALKFTRRGRVALIARVLTGPQAGADGVRVRVEVIDSGIGIDEKARATLFHPFTQAERSTTRRFGGTGLGLSISRRLIELMRGHIGVDSEPGVGSTFWFEVDLDRLPDTALGPLPPGLDGRLIQLRIADGFLRDTVTSYLHAADARVQMRGGDGGAADGPPADAIVLTLADGTPWPDGLPAGCPAVLITPPDALPHPDQPAAVRTVPRPLRRDALLTTLAAALGGGTDAPPVTPSPGPAPRVRPSREEAIRRNILVLVAEDQPVNQMVIRRQLDLLGVAADIADDGAQALNLWRQGGYGLLLTDCNMPELDGFELTAAIRAAETRTGRRTPIIALTANAIAGESQRCLGAGMDGFLPKPVTLARLEECVSTWLPSALDDGGTPPRTTAQTGAAAPAVLDQGFLDELFGDELGERRQFLAEFLEAAPPFLDTIDRTLALDDAAAARGAAHALAGVAKSAGALELGALADQVEAALSPDTVAVTATVALNQARIAAAGLRSALLRVVNRIHLL